MTKTFSIVRAATLAMIASGFVALAPVAHAADDPLPSASIDITRIDFTSPKAVDHVTRLVRNRALEICLGDARYEAGMNRQERDCFDTALKSGLAQIESKRQQALRETSVHMADANPQTASH